MERNTKYNKDPNWSYIFTSRPRPPEIPSKYQKLPDEWPLFQYRKKTHNRRVLRGGSHAQNISAGDRSHSAETERQHETKRKTFQKHPKEQSCSLTPKGLPGRAPTGVQTELHLDALDAKDTPDMDCQTDPFLDKPTSPLFTFVKTGKDFFSQTEEGQYFDFDAEVELLLEVLVEKVIEQSLMEVMEEEELACLKAEQQAFEDLRHYKLAEVKQLEEQDRRYRLEKERRHAEQREVLQKDGEISQKIAAQAYTQQYISELLQIASTPPLTPDKDIQRNFIPWLMYRIDNLCEMKNAARELLDSVIADMARKRLDRLKDLKEETTK